MVVPPIGYLQKLKASSIKSLLLNIGSKQTGTKAVLSQRLCQDLVTPKLRIGTSNGRQSNCPRILSIDMGVKNLAFCVADVALPKGRDAPTLTVRHWKRLSVLDRALSTTTFDHGDLDKSSDIVGDNEKSDNEALMTPAALFQPQNLAPIAIQLIKEEFLIHNPSTILIERQRFRTGGASAVQEWTLRVNMLESMIWAALLTICEPQQSIYAVNPASVASFWFPGWSKVEKTDKVDLVGSWLEGEQDHGIHVDFNKWVGDIKDLFAKRKERRTRNANGSKTKLDDLADCLLQAGAWAKWETNRQWLLNASESDMEKFVAEHDSKME